MEGVAQAAMDWVYFKLTCEIIIFFSQGFTSVNKCKFLLVKMNVINHLIFFAWLFTPSFTLLFFLSLPLSISLRRLQMSWFLAWLYHGRHWVKTDFRTTYTVHTVHQSTEHIMFSQAFGFGLFNTRHNGDLISYCQINLLQLAVFFTTDSNIWVRLQNCWKNCHIWFGTSFSEKTHYHWLWPFYLSLSFLSLSPCICVCVCVLILCVQILPAQKVLSLQCWWVHPVLAPGGRELPLQQAQQGEVGVGEGCGRLA